MLLWANLTLCHLSTICSSFSSQFIMSHFSSIRSVLCWFFTWIALGDVDLHFSSILVTKTNVDTGGTTASAWLYQQHNQFIQVLDRMTVISLSARIEHGSCVPNHVNPKIIMYHLCQTALNQKLLHKFGKWCQFSSHDKMKLHKMRPACIWISCNRKLC